MNNIRNFAIIAHVDHGKSTLADRLLELTGVVTPGHHQEQLLDRNPISRERGITIKLAPVRMQYQISKFKNPYFAKAPQGRQNDTSKFKNISNSLNTEYSILNTSNSEFILNLIDTPGHVDFSYEVERTLSCVEGVVLLVDATAGIQAQTIAHTLKAIDQKLTIIPVINKVDLASAEVETAKKELADFLKISDDEIFQISAKTGQGVSQLLNSIVQLIPSPKSTSGVEEMVRRLIFDSYYDSYRGVIAFVRVFNGQIKKGNKLKLIGSDRDFTVDEVGIFSPELTPKETLSQGEIGYIVTKLKDIHLVRVGDTVTSVKSGATPLPGYKICKPMVFATIFPTDPDQFIRLKESLEKLSLNDAAISYRPVYSKSLGSGFRVGFLGLLHAEVVVERLEREFNLSLVLTPPTVDYEQKDNLFFEPIADVMIVTPKKYVGPVMKFSDSCRGKFITMDSKIHIYLHYEIPLAEVISNFFDGLKSITSGYASFDWSFKEYQPCQAGLLQILLNDEKVIEFDEYIVDSKAQSRGQFLTSRLKDLIPRQQYEVKIQAYYKGKIIAATRIAPFRKDVTQKLYGGDRTRKDKLLKKQKKGKSEMKNIGRVEIPKQVFLKLFRG
jgi:GTP-binding protein LepA